MKPTQQEIIEFAKQAKLGTALSHGGGDLRIFIEGADWHEELLRFAELLLERFGAGGGEPVAYVCPTSHVTADGSMEDGPDYLEWADEARDYEKRVGCPLYTHPSPTGLRAEYLRGLEDAIGIIEGHRIPVGNSAAGEMACEWTYDALHTIRDEIRALKDKQ